MAFTNMLLPTNLYEAYGQILHIFALSIFADALSE